VGAPKVAYRETILRSCQESYKHVKQTGGRGQYGHVEIILEPAESGKGFEFVNAIKGGSIPKEYIPAVEKGIIDIMQRGVYAGHPVVDVKVTLVDGSYHEVDSSELAFKLAAAECFKNAFLKADPVILEPYMSVEVTTPQEYMGNITGDICSRRGKIMGMEAKVNQQILIAETPLSEMFGYASSLRTISSGRAVYSMHFEKYIKAPNDLTEKILEEARQAKEARHK
jgi:elongation factor G